MIREGLEVAVVRAVSFDCGLAADLTPSACYLCRGLFWLSGVSYAFRALPVFACDSVLMNCCWGCVLQEVVA